MAIITSTPGLYSFSEPQIERSMVRTLDAKRLSWCALKSARQNSSWNREDN